MTTIDHVLMTRFNLPSPGYEETVRTRDGWLETRVGLFERYCLPSVRAQECQDFAWVVYFDPESPPWLRDRIEEWRDTLIPIFRREVSRDSLMEDLRKAAGGDNDLLLTTNLDNDDAIAASFTARVQKAARRTADTATAIYLAEGLIAGGGRLYRRRDPANAFCSVSAPWAAGKTCWADWHNELGRNMPVSLDFGDPGWLQVVHGTNVSNRVHGAMTSPLPYAPLFPGLLDHLPEPALADRVLDLAVARPLRLARDTCRELVKRAVVAVAGRAALDRVRHRMRQWGPTRGRLRKG
ncbi:glycosyltransferase [Sinomonas flava]|uniref:glycosyltransferase n=1 Tax=Sinomonas flava TaxID=496857 RepID=UPI0039A537C1